MGSENNDKKAWTENFRILSPLLLLSLNVLAGVLISNQSDIKNNLGEIDVKLFKHLTNDEIHCPRSIMVPRAEFDLVTKMREQQISEIKNTIKDEFSQLRIEIRNPQVYKRER